MQRISFQKPCVPVNSRALIKPAVAKAGIDARNQIILAAVVHKITHVELKGSVTVVIPANEVAVQKYQGVAECAVELDSDSPPEVLLGDFKDPSIPPHAGLGIGPSERLVAMVFDRIIVHEGQLHRPIMRQIQRPPFRIIKLRGGKLEAAGFGKIALIFSEIQVARRVSRVPLKKLPIEVEQQVLARGNQRSSLR